MVAEAHSSAPNVKRYNMVIFLYGEDSYRSKRKLEEIIDSYKKIHKSGLNLVNFDADKGDFKDFLNNLKITSMFDEKKLIILKDVFSNKNFEEGLLENIKILNKSKDIIVIYEKVTVDKRSKLLKILEKEVKCQEFNYLQPALLKKWIKQEVEINKSKIDSEAEDILMAFVGSNLWQMANEIKKLSDYKKGGVIKKEDVELQVKNKIESDIFKTIDALASKNKKQALDLLHKHIENGDGPLYLLSMISYQFRNLLIIKELQDEKKPYEAIVKKSGLHPFVVKKSYYLCNKFSFLDLKKIYKKIFQVDSDIKTGKIEPETALDMLVFEI